MPPVAPAAPVRTAVLPVAGFGTRLLPATKAVPKELLPLLDRPLLHHAVAEAAAVGVERVVLVTMRDRDALPDYFDAHPELERHLAEQGEEARLAELQALRDRVEVVTVRQGPVRGLGRAVLAARAVVGSEPFAVMLVDDLVDADTPALGQLLAAWSPGQAVLALVEVPAEDTGRYGICAGPWQAPGRMAVRQMVEKPDPAHSPGRHAIIGRYLLPADVFEVLAATPPGARGEVQLTDALAVLAGQDRVTGVLLSGQRFDAGSLEGWLLANLHHALKRPELAARIRAALDAP